MLRIFLSSTSRDLKDERKGLLNDITSALEDVSMENFIPDGRDPHQACIEQLRKSDIAIFLISPFYGSCIDECRIADCKADCPMKDGSGKISYTHCEYKVCLADGKPHLTYLVDKDWDLVSELKGKDAVDWKEIRRKYNYADYSNETIEHYFKVADLALQFRDEVEKELRIPIADVKGITSDLAESIVKWYQNRKIDLEDFSGRRNELKDLTDKMEECVELYGIGGIGKTSLIQVALLIQKLNGRRIVTIGTRQSYASGSGYRHFKEKCANESHEIIGNELTLEDIARALGIYEMVVGKDAPGKIRIISDYVKDNNISLFLDDFHLSSKDTRALPAALSGGVILASKKRIGCARSEICLMGIEEEDRYRFIDLAAERFSKILDKRARDAIFQIAEGHPISTEMLVRNFDKIDFEELKSFKESLKDSDPNHVEELIKRTVKEILNDNAYSLIKKFALINTDVETDIDRKIVEKIQGKNSAHTFNQLIDTGMISKKKFGKTAYSFSYRHIQDAIMEDRKEDRMWAINYYSNKIRNYKNDLDRIEMLYHQSISNPKEKHAKDFIDLCNRIGPGKIGFIRLIDIGENLIPRFERNRSHSAPLHGSIAYLYHNLADFERTGVHYRMALQLFEDLAEQNPEAFNSDLSWTLNNLGILYSDLKEFEKSEEHYRRALQLREILAKQNPEVFNSGLAVTLNNLGNLYSYIRDFDKAEEHYKWALYLYEDLAKQNPEAFYSSLASTLNNLGTLYSDLRDFDKAEEHDKRALQLREDLAKRNPEAFNSDLAGTLNNLGNLCSDLRDFDKAERHYKRALQLYEDLAKRNPEAFNSDLAMTLNNLGFLYSDLRNFDEAEEHYKRALQLREDLAKRNPEAFNSDLASTLGNLGNLYSCLWDFEKAETHLERSLKICELLAARNPEAFNSDLCEALNDFGNLCRDKAQIERSKEFYKGALSIAHDLNEKNYKAFGHLLIMIKADMARLYIEMGRENEAIDCLSGCLEKKDLLKDLGARSFVAFGKAKEMLHDSNSAAESYLSASSTYFILSRKGVCCFDDVLENLRAADRLSSEDSKGDIEMIRYAIQYLKSNDIKLPKSPVSDRGMKLRSALDGIKPEFSHEPDSIVDEMVLTLSRDLYEKSTKSHC
ncbi:MAG TPA: tetratricopeptide repeat protein [Methanothrix sp.]|nr:tetratricopeptide repeat protein [Methanothrix sp.]